MALSHLLQPKSCLAVRRLRFSTARTRCCYSLCSNGEIDNPQQLNKEAVAEESSTMAVEPFVKESLEKKPGLLSKATLISNEVSAYGGSMKSTRLTDLFREHKDNQIATENKGTKPEEAISDLLLNFAKYRNTQSECLSDSFSLLPSGPASDSQDDHLLEIPPNKCENDLPEYQNARPEEGKSSSPSNSIQEILDIKDCYVKSAYNQAAGEVVKPRSLTFSYQPFEHSNEPQREDEEKVSEIKGLIDFIRMQEDLPVNTTKRCRKAGPIKENSVNVNLQRSDNNDRLRSLLDFPAGTSRIEDEEKSNLAFKSIDCTQLKARVEVSVPTSNKDQKRLTKTCSTGKESEENKVLVRFLRHDVTENEIFQNFNSCGKILKVEFPHAKGPLFKAAHIYFKTRTGLENALKISGLFGGCQVIVESASTKEKRAAKFPIPSLIGDPDVPAALVKNPTRTIKIEQLTHKISSHHIEEALSFCQSNISGYFLGSSQSVAFVEFETEIGKERALAKQCINVLGRPLVMQRIDSPRTTVVRISNIESLDLKSILPICRSLGDFKASMKRSNYILDVHYGITEWPNMLKILNRLNGLEVEGRRLQAEAAPVFPPHVLLALWHQPEERKHLKAISQGLLHKLGEKAVDISELASLQHIFVDKL